MGEKNETKKEAGEKQTADAGGTKKADNDPITVILKLDLHCDGCAKKVKKSIRHFEGVESVKTDSVNNKLTITGRVDPARIKERVELKTKKKVEVISPQPKKDAGSGDGGEKKSGDKLPVKISDDKKLKEPELATVVLKIPLHCDGCIHKILRIISKFDGVESVRVDANKNLVTVIGTMNMKEFTTHLKEKLKRNVDIVPPKKEDNKGDDKKEGKKAEGGGAKKEKESKNDDVEKKKIDGAKVSGGGDAGEKKKNDEVKVVDGGGGDEKKSTDGEKRSTDGEGKIGASGGDKGKSVEVVNKSEYYRHNPYIYMMPMYNQNYHNQDYGILASSSHSYMNEVYANHGHIMEYPHGPQLPPPPMYLHDPRTSNTEIFSVENPNACSLM